MLGRFSFGRKSEKHDDDDDDDDSEESEDDDVAVEQEHRHSRQPRFKSRAFSKQRNHSLQSDESYADALEHALRSAGGQLLQLRDTDASRTFFDTFAYRAENTMAQHGSAPYVVLWALFGCLTIFFGTLWYITLGFVRTTSLEPYDGDYEEDDHHRRGLMSESVVGDMKSTLGYRSYHDSLWFSVQLLGAAGIDYSVPDVFVLRVIYFSCLISGLFIFAILIGFITDSVAQFMTSLSAGRTKVVEKGHTLILGTNEATERVVTQLALLRRQHMVVNETWKRRFFPWLRVPPSSPVDAAPVVVMTDSMTKPELNEALRLTLCAAGINPKRTAVGKNVICRVGDPTNIQDLMRVSADTAATIVLMLTERDMREFLESDGRISNGATLRTLLALRHVILTSANETVTSNVVVQLSHPANHLEAASFKDTFNRSVVRPVDLSFMVNGLMFGCAEQPGLSNVLMQLLDCDGPAFRRRLAQHFCGGVVGLTLREAGRRLNGGTVIGLTNSAEDGDHLADGYGILANPDRKINENELVIFVSETASPMRSLLKEHYGPADLKEAAALSDRGDFTVEDEIRHTLVCGWRPVWTDECDRLNTRISQLKKKAARGSTIVFANNVPMELFEELLLEATGLVKHSAGEFGNDHDGGMVFPKDTWITPEGILLEHIRGDCADGELIAPLMQSRPFTIAIVLGSQARASGVELSPMARDTRILDILMMMRYLHEQSKFNDVHLHVISENNIDDTAMLALAPRDLTAKAALAATANPDFINTQAIFARTLVLSAAYPLVFPSIMDLFDENDGAFVKLKPAGFFVPLHEPVKWGVVQARVDSWPDSTENNNYIAFGIILKARLHLNILNGKKIAFSEEDRIACFARNTNPKKFRFDKISEKTPPATPKTGSFEKIIEASPALV